MEKVCGKYTVKTSPIPFLNFGKLPKTANACKKLLKIGYFVRDIYEKQKIQALNLNIQIHINVDLV